MTGSFESHMSWCSGGEDRGTVSEDGEDSYERELSAVEGGEALVASSANSPISQGAAHTPWAPGAPGAARADCSRLEMPKHCDLARRRQGRVFAPGDARVERLHPATSEHTTFSPLRQSTASMSGATKAELSSTQRRQSRMRSQSSMLASRAARAECWFPPLPKLCACVRRCQCSVLAPGAARAEYSFPPLHATSPSQSTRWRIHPPSGDHSPILYAPAAARASYSCPLSTP
ncbi:hypothetical protein DFP73DRAFT_596231 [Morchella snyderi]|nr:hypothetical protein DFP73DRAFT_596231 [Morchella snyderi]